MEKSNKIPAFLKVMSGGGYFRDLALDLRSWSLFRASHGVKLSISKFLSPIISGFSSMGRACFCRFSNSGSSVCIVFMVLFFLLFSSKVKTCSARLSVKAGRPASFATCMPYERSAAPLITSCIKITSPLNSLIFIQCRLRAGRCLFSSVSS